MFTNRPRSFCLITRNLKLSALWGFCSQASKCRSKRSKFRTATPYHIESSRAVEYVFYIYGEILYEDVFGASHKSQISAFLFRNPSFTELASCATYNYSINPSASPVTATKVLVSRALSSIGYFLISARTVQVICFISGTIIWRTKCSPCRPRGGRTPPPPLPNLRVSTKVCRVSTLKVRPIQSPTKCVDENVTSGWPTVVS